MFGRKRPDPLDATFGEPKQPSLIEAGFKAIDRRPPLTIFVRSKMKNDGQWIVAAQLVQPNHLPGVRAHMRREAKKLADAARENEYVAEVDIIETEDQRAAQGGWRCWPPA